MPDTAALLAAAGVLVGLGAVLALVALFSKPRTAPPAKWQRVLFGAAFGLALCGVALSVLVGTLAAGQALGWF